MKIKNNQQRFNANKYPIGAYIRSFTKESLSRVPQDDDDYPIVEESPEDITEKQYKLESVMSGPNKKNEYKVKWKGYKTPTWEPYDSIKDSKVFEKYKQRT